MNTVKRITLIYLLLLMANGHCQSYSYKVKYGMVQAGTAKLVHNLEKGVLTSFLSIQSSPWLSNLWTLSDSIRSIYLVESGELKSHIKAIHEGTYHRNYLVNFVDSNMVSINGKEHELNTQGIKDIPSLLFDLSRTHFQHGDTLRYRLWDGRGFGVLNLAVEKAIGPSLFKPFSAAGWKLSPLNSTKKSRENQIQLAMMYSESYPHEPLRIEIGTKYGNVIMRLVKR
ncbi:DUF3108 domain-containing protein [bacterium]|nr:DUF3108 domain-containing protein [bacterium]